MARISDCCEKEYCWYFIYIVHGNGGERDHCARRKKRNPAGDAQSFEEAAVNTRV